MELSYLEVKIAIFQEGWSLILRLLYLWFVCCSLESLLFTIIYPLFYSKLSIIIFMDFIFYYFLILIFIALYCWKYHYWFTCILINIIIIIIKFICNFSYHILFFHYKLIYFFILFSFSYVQFRTRI